MLKPVILAVGSLSITSSGSVGATTQKPMSREVILSIRKSSTSSRSPGRGTFIIKPAKVYVM